MTVSAIGNSLNWSQALSFLNGTYLYEAATWRSPTKGPSFSRLTGTSACRGGGDGVGGGDGGDVAPERDKTSSCIPSVAPGQYGASGNNV